jgi:hypothetical protein
MTKQLSDILGAREPSFRLGLRQLETASGLPSEDIRLSTEIEQNVREGLRELGLDPYDTTGPELYNALQQHIKADDAVVNELLTVDSNDSNLMLRIQRFVNSLDIPKTVFALKTVAAKRLIKANPPKKAMKYLGYRSLASMLKHESPPQIYAAAAIFESAPWYKSMTASYKNLSSTDFELREVQLLAPNNRRWEKIAMDYIDAKKNNIFTFNELGAIVMLPLSTDALPGASITSLVLVLHAVNNIRISSAYLKFHQVKPDFGEIVSESALNEPYARANIIGERLPWKLIQRFFSISKNYIPELFEPHVQRADLKIFSVENILAKLHPQLAFWHNKNSAALIHDHKPVSFNLTDAALNFCNGLSYEQRILKYLRENVWQDLMLRYMHQNSLERTVSNQLSDELVDKNTYV